MYVKHDYYYCNYSIYDKLVQFLGLDEFGTNYPKERFDPHEWMEESHYDHLGRPMFLLPLSPTKSCQL